MTDLYLPVATSAAALLGLIYLFQTLSVVKVRRAKAIVHGDAGDKTAMKRIRGHANFAEQVPLFLILLALCELQSTSCTVLAVIAAIFIVGRVMHAYYFLDIGAHFRFRQFGMLATLLAQFLIIVAALSNLIG